MSKHVTHKFPDDGKLSEREAQKLLGVLCVKYGFCLPPLWHARLERNPPRSIDKFLDTVFRAEGLDPIAADGGMYKAMREEVRSAFERSKSNHEAPDAYKSLEPTPVTKARFVSVSSGAAQLKR